MVLSQVRPAPRKVACLMLTLLADIELLNEPVLGYSSLLPFYTAASNIVGAANSSGINTTISGKLTQTCLVGVVLIVKDGFFEPHTWENYNPWNPSAQSPAQHITIDTHQFWAFPPLTDLTKPQILQQICKFAQEQLRAEPSLGIPPTLVGEWSLSTGKGAITQTASIC